MPGGWGGEGTLNFRIDGGFECWSESINPSTALRQLNQWYHHVSSSSEATLQKGTLEVLILLNNNI